MRHGFRRRVVHLSVVIGVVLTAGLAKEKKKDPNKDPDEIGNRDFGKGVKHPAEPRSPARVRLGHLGIPRSQEASGHAGKPPQAG